VNIILISGWLEPLLYPIAQDWSNVTTPIIEIIFDNNFKFEITREVSQLQIGRFDLGDMTFKWMPQTKFSKSRQEQRIDPLL
jgi:hypothetical protein